MNETQTTETDKKNVCTAANWKTSEQDLLFDLKCLAAFQTKCACVFMEEEESLPSRFPVFSKKGEPPQKGARPRVSCLIRRKNLLCLRRRAGR